ncbi:hypothetical protein scyTo_0000233 [Scyliorhinus torazame]|uniref:Uncharacterized protein n=1 Tax=Scyliorhinus torazame TaxID=75743 RepID=A0A401NT30_SCYTO|nr:hypothetical protein [Scyliorhinus torazame]
MQSKESCVEKIALENGIISIQNFLHYRLGLAAGIKHGPGFLFLRWLRSQECKLGALASRRVQIRKLSFIVFEELSS